MYTSERKQPILCPIAIAVGQPAGAFVFAKSEAIMAPSVGKETDPKGGIQAGF